MPTSVIRPDILAQTAYPVADAPADFIKLDAMEVPYQFPEALRAELAAELATAPINRYPNIAASPLPELLRRTFALPENAQIVLGNGSDEIIQFITLLVAQANASVLAVEPSFVMYRRNAELFGLNYIGVPLNPDFTLNLEATLKAIEQHKPALIFLAYPNNPTGVPFSREAVEAIIQAATGIVVIDEAYGAFSHDSFIAQAGQPENLVVMRTLSKIGFAGLRVGYAVGSPAVMGELAKIMPPYNMNQLSLVAAAFALRHADVFAQNIETLKNERARVANALAELEDVTVFPSEANFVTARLPDAPLAFNTLKDNKILVKNLHGAHPLLQNCLRLTIGTPEENDQVLRVLANVIADHIRAKQSGFYANADAIARLNAGMIKGVLLAVALFSLMSIYLCSHYFSDLVVAI